MEIWKVYLEDREGRNDVGGGTCHVILEGDLPPLSERV